MSDSQTPRTNRAWKCCEIHGPATRAVQMTKFAEALELELADETKRRERAEAMLREIGSAHRERDMKESADCIDRFLVYQECAK